MYLIREVFNCIPGKAKDLVKVFKEALPLMIKDGIKNGKVMTDMAANYWTVVVEFEVKDLGEFAEKARTETSDSKLKDIFKDYMKFVEGGKREIFLLE